MDLKKIQDIGFNIAGMFFLISVFFLDDVSDKNVSLICGIIFTSTAAILGRME